MMAFREEIFGRRPKRQKGALGRLNKERFSLMGQHVIGHQNYPESQSLLACLRDWNDFPSGKDVIDF